MAAENQGLEDTFKAPRSRDSGTAIDELKSWLVEDTRRTLALLGRLVPYSRFARFEMDGEEVVLSVERYLQLAQLASLDLFTAKDDVAKRGLIGVRAGEDLDDTRNHPQYAAIVSAYLQGLDLLEESSMKAWSEQMERLAPKEIAMQMISATKPKDRLAAAAEFVDRTAPKASRSGEGGTVIFLSEGAIQVIERTQELMKEVNFSGSIEVSARQVPAPKRLTE